jgi:adenine-specific DNA-methyltransferase
MGRLNELGSDNPGINLFGCDISDEAFCHLSNTPGLHSPTGHFIKSDYLSLQYDAFLGQKFDAVIGNPPYVSHHNMAVQQKLTAECLSVDHEWGLDKKASLWTYFVLHSMGFLQAGGRAAWILPGSMIFADYGRQVREHLFRHFDRCLLVWIGERLFLSEGTEERTVVLFCEGYHVEEKSGSEHFGFASDIDALENIVSRWDQGLWNVAYPDDRPVLAVMNPQAKSAYMDLATNPDTKLLGNIARVQIGIVTGANEFFIIDANSANALNLPDKVLTPILAKFNFAPGLTLTAQDMNLARGSNKRCLLVDTSRVDEINGPLANYLASFPEEKLGTIRTFEKRLYWYRPNDGRIPDAFFPYMQDAGPWLIQNTAGLLSTNTIHRVFFNDAISDSMRKLASISMLTTFSQLSAEIEGRIYGSGVLKHEPSEAERIALLLPPDLDAAAIDYAFHSIDCLWRSDKKAQAHRKADEYIMDQYYGNITERDDIISLLTEQLMLVRSMRRTAKQKT